MKICSVEGCGKKSLSGGLCKKHYQAAWYIANSERLCLKNKVYAETHKEERKLIAKKNAVHTNELRRANYAKNPELKRAMTRAWEQANPEKVKASKRAHSKKRSKHIMGRVREWVRKNPEKRKANVSKWDKANRDSCNARDAKRRATKLNATPKWANTFFIKEAYELANLRTKMFGFRWEVDHIVPLQSKIVCGLHVENNLRVIPLRDNRTKSNIIWPNMPT